jgi:glycosyltransferase involved in cell wall biosynthesis
VGTFTQVLGRAVTEAGHTVRVAGVYPPSYPGADYEADGAVRIWRLREPPGRLGWVRAQYRLYRLMRAWAADRQVDLIEAPDCFGSFAGWPRLPVPLVTRAHGSLTYYAYELGRRPAPMGHRLERWSYARTDTWVAVSKHAGSVTQQLFGLPTGPARVIYNPVPVPRDVTPYARRIPGSVVFAGTLTEKKGIVALIDAWPSISAAVPEAHLTILGKDCPRPEGGTMVDFLRARLPSELRRSVQFCGHVERAEVQRTLSQARVAVFPSLTETFGLAAGEAMASGCATVYTTRTCGPEIVRDGVDGLLANPLRPSDIASAVVRLLTDVKLAERLSAAGRVRVCRDFGREAITEANLSFYDDVVSSFRRARGQ